MAMRRPTRIIAKLRRSGLSSLTKEECCLLMAWHLERVYAWELIVWNKIWGTGGGGTPPPPPKWPPA